jgi:hypothetical protein
VLSFARLLPLASKFTAISVLTLQAQIPQRLPASLLRPISASRWRLLWIERRRMSSTPTVKLTPYDAFCLVLMSTINSLYFVENLFLRLTKKVRLVGRQLGRSKSLHGISKVAPEFNLGFLPSVIIFKKTLFQYSRSGIRVSQRLFSSSIFALAKSRKEGLLYQAVVGYRVHLDLFRFPIIPPIQFIRVRDMT